jgi:hypothetical protein
MEAFQVSRKVSKLELEPTDATVPANDTGLEKATTIPSFSQHNEILNSMKRSISFEAANDNEQTLPVENNVTPEIPQNTSLDLKEPANDTAAFKTPEEAAQLKGVLNRLGMQPDANNAAPSELPKPEEVIPEKKLEVAAIPESVSSSIQPEVLAAGGASSRGFEGGGGDGGNTEGEKLKSQSGPPSAPPPVPPKTPELKKNPEKKPSVIATIFRKILKSPPSLLFFGLLGLAFKGIHYSIGEVMKRARGSAGGGGGSKPAAKKAAGGGGGGHH